MRNLKVKTLVTVGLLTAISVVLSIYPFTFYLTDSIRITFREVPIVLVACLFGPYYAAACAFLSDLCGTLFTGLGWNPVLSMLASLFGFLAGWGYRLCLRRFSEFGSLAVSVLFANLAGPICLVTAVLSFLYGTPYLALLSVRLPLYLVLSAVQIIAVKFLLPLAKSILYRGSR